jgi:hypothetical protein
MTDIDGGWSPRTGRRCWLTDIEGPAVVVSAPRFGVGLRAGAAPIETNALSQDTSIRRWDSTLVAEVRRI